MALILSNETQYSLDEYEEIYNFLFNQAKNELKKVNDYTVSVTFVDKNFIHELNKNYRGIDKETDVISFAFLDDVKEKEIVSKFPTDLGEIYICVDVAKENAKSYGNSLERELKFLFVHGILHLFGYDHQTLEEEQIMFSLQDKILEG